MTLMKQILFLLSFLIISIRVNSQTKTWDGGSTANDYWHTDCNWNPDGVPACTDICTIPTGNNVVILTGIIAHCEQIHLQGTATLDIQGTGKLEVSSANTCVGTKSSASAGCANGTWGAGYIDDPFTTWGCNPFGPAPQVVGSPCSVGDVHYYFGPGGTCGDCWFPDPCYYQYRQDCN